MKQSMMHNINDEEKKLLLRIKTAIISDRMNQVRKFRTVFEKKHNLNNVKYKNIFYSMRL